ncbi:hypothetical protein [Gordonibacter sp.]|uniref:hypothetical protein n=1 Tax=Gordonibacter sp. TaxID=1968902 RepID=UPI002FC8A69A
MNEDEFRQSYAQLEEGIKASEELKYRTKKSLGRAARFPAGKIAFAACLAVFAGVGLLFGTGALEKIGATLAGNTFALVAYAEESPTDGGGHAGISLEKFHPTRTSAGYLYDASSDTVDFSVVTVSRYYSFDMTVAGKNVESVAYSIEGEGVCYGSWKSDRGSEGTVAQETSQSFIVAYDDGTQVVREIGLNYVLDEEEKAEFDRLYGTSDADGMETLLAVCDAKRLAGTSITATATFADKTSQTKSYGFEAAEGFEGMYRAYLSQWATDPQDTGSWASLAGEPSLFNLVEKSR